MSNNQSIHPAQHLRPAAPQEPTFVVVAHTNPVSYHFESANLQEMVNLYESLLIAKIRKTTGLVNDYPNKGEQTIIFGDIIGSISANIPTEKLTTIQRRHGIC